MIRGKRGGVKREKIIKTVFKKQCETGRGAEKEREKGPP